MAQSTPEPSGGSPFPWVQVALATAALVVMIALILATAQIPVLTKLEYSSADIRTALFSERVVNADHPDVAVVTITEETIRLLPVRSPIDRGFLASLISTIDAAGPRAIGLDVFFLRATDEAKDTALKDALRNAKASVVLAAFDERGSLPQANRDHQTAFIASTGRSAGYINLQQDDDGVVRSNAVPARNGRFPDSLPLLLARSKKPDVQVNFGRIAWLQRVDSTSFVSKIANWEGRQPFPIIPAEQVLDQSKPEIRKRLEGKIVLIGAHYINEDRHRTPLTAWTKEDMPGVFIHAQHVSQLLDGRRFTEFDPGKARVLALALAVLGGLAGWRFRNRKFDYLSWSVATAIMMAIDAFVFSYLNLILPYLMSMLAWFSGVTAGHNLGLFYDWELRRSGRKA